MSDAKPSLDEELCQLRKQLESEKENTLKVRVDELTRLRAAGRNAPTPTPPGGVQKQPPVLSAEDHKALRNEVEREVRGKDGVEIERTLEQYRASRERVVALEGREAHLGKLEEQEKARSLSDTFNERSERSLTDTFNARSKGLEP